MINDNFNIIIVCNIYSFQIWYIFNIKHNRKSKFLFFYLYFEFNFGSHKMIKGTLTTITHVLFWRDDHSTMTEMLIY